LVALCLGFFCRPSDYWLDASAHTSEETIGASLNVPRGIVRSVLVSGLFGWVMLSAVVCAPDCLPQRQRGRVLQLVGDTLPALLAMAFYAGIPRQYLRPGYGHLGFAWSRFARDGLPGSRGK
jgi:hypothetical protein